MGWRLIDAGADRLGDRVRAPRGRCATCVLSPHRLTSRHESLFGAARAWLVGVGRQLDHYGQGAPSPLVEAVFGRCVFGHHKLAGTSVFSSTPHEDIGHTDVGLYP